MVIAKSYVDIAVVSQRELANEKWTTTLGIEDGEAKTMYDTQFANNRTEQSRVKQIIELLYLCSCVYLRLRVSTVRASSQPTITYAVHCNANSYAALRQRKMHDRGRQNIHEGDNNTSSFSTVIFRQCESYHVAASPIVQLTTPGDSLLGMIL
jgi:hypothetical protein